MFSRTMTRSTSGEAALHAGQVPHRPQVRVEIERLAQADVDAGEALADRRRDRALERDLVALDRVEQSDAGSVSFVFSKAMTPASWRSQSMSSPAALKMRDDRFGDFRADAVAGNEGDRCGSWKSSASSQSSVESSVGRQRIVVGASSCRRDRFEQRAIARHRTRATLAIAVDVDLAEHVVAVHDRHDDLRLRLDAARQIARIRIHVVDDDRRPFRWRRRRRCRGRAECACAATACRRTARGTSSSPSSR